MALNKVEERIPARMPPEVYERIAAAAQAIGATINVSFRINTLLISHL
jgi:hypothetical protein